ncbi:DUF2993 domain-containing protein [Nocardia sp. NPDC005366]|uniref:LmeA family phospholipid-binding protein n=1 Tax=Nocardia sp. NPDC005366 TaxID=3156878 RepID=UPI0033BC9250
MSKPSAFASVSRRTLVIAITLVVTLLAAVLVGGEAYARHQLAGCISTQFEQEMGSKIDVGFGFKPLLVSWIDGNLSTVTVDSEGDKFGPAVGMVVHAKFHDLEVTDNGRGGGTVGSSSADVTWSNAGIRETLGDLVTGVRSSSSTHMLTLDVLGGLAQLQVQPQVRNGVVEVETKSARLLGVGMPTDLVQGIVDIFSQSLQSYPMGLKPTAITVTDNGIDVRLAGGRTELPASGTKDVSC